MRVFVTGASGWIGSAVVPELIGAGHEVVGLARSASSAAALEAAGAEAVSGDLDDVDVLRAAAEDSDGVIHLAFRHDLVYAGDLASAAVIDRTAIEAFGKALEGSDRPFVIASGVTGLTPGRVATELDGHDLSDVVGPTRGRRENAELTLSFASRGIRSSIVRLPASVHGEGDNGFVHVIVGVARAKDVSAFIGDGANRWPAVHRLDAARLFRLALEQAPPGSTLHGVGDEGVTIREIASVIGRHLEIPVASISQDAAPEHFGALSHFLAVDGPASSERTRKLLGWQPAHPGLIEDLEQGHYFQETEAAAAVSS
jgi:nucleoside-diphosphate-sugar epimerase